MVGHGWQAVGLATLLVGACAHEPDPAPLGMIAGPDEPPLAVVSLGPDDAPASGPAGSRGLEVRWRVAFDTMPELTSTLEAPVGGGGGVAIWRTTAPAIFDVANGARHDIGSESSSAIAVGGVAIHDWPGSIAAFDGDGGQRWSLATPGFDLVGSTELAGAAAGGTLVVTRAQAAGYGDEVAFADMIGVDLASGRPLWRRRAALPSVRAIAAGRGRVYTAGTSGVAAHDLATGRPLWRWGPPYAGRVQCAIGRGVAATGDAVVALRGCGQLVVLEASTGRLAREIDFGAADVAALAVRGPIAYVGFAGGPVRAIDLSTGAVRWSAPVALDAVQAGIVVGRELVFTQDATGKVVALDRASGARAGEYALGVPGGFALGAGAGGAEVLVGPSASGHVIALAPTASAVPPPAVEVRGLVHLHDETGRRPDGPLGGVHVRVGSDVVVTDPTGRFRHTLRARGAVEIALEPADVPSSSPLGCFARPTWVLAEEAATTEAHLLVLCPAPC